jgi:hypothetical protein
MSSSAHQLEDFLDRYPVCFEQVHRGHQRIIAGLQSRQRYPGESCITKGTGKAGKESFSKVQENKQQSKKGKGQSVYLQQQ